MNLLLEHIRTFTSSLIGVNEYNEVLNEEFLSDLEKRMDRPRKLRGTRLSPRFDRIKHRIGNVRTRTIYFKTPSQTGSRTWTQRIRIPEFKDITRIRKNTSLEEKIRLALQAGHVKVHCDCPDFLYKGYEWMSDAGEYGIEKQNIPPNVRNPELEGSMCKHLSAVTNNINRFMPQIVQDWEAYAKLVRQKRK